MTGPGETSSLGSAVRAARRKCAVEMYRATGGADVCRFTLLPQRIAELLSLRELLGVLKNDVLSQVSCSCECDTDDRSSSISGALR